MEQVFGNYRTRGFIGEGRVGSVYRAVNPANPSQQVAIKVIKQGLAQDAYFRQQFALQAQEAASLDHANIVRVFSYDAVAPLPYIVLEYIGGNLKSYLENATRQGRMLDPSHVARFGQGTAEALDYASRIGVIHTDLKPSNILLKPPASGAANLFQPVISDFGLAKLIYSIPGPLKGPSAASLPYMSPERCKGERVDSRSDLYSLGAVLYELLTGQPPFRPRSMNEAIDLHSRQPVVPPSRLRPGIPSELEQTILRSLAKDPNARFQTSGDMARVLGGGRAAAPIADRTSFQAVRPGQNLKTVYEPDKPIRPDMPQYSNFPVTSADAGKARIIFAQEGQAPYFVWLSKSVMNIGREQGQDLILDAPHVSRQHARLDRGNDGRYYIMDLGASNGVWLETTQLNPRVAYEWRPGQVVRIGEFWLKLEVIPASSDNQRPSIPAPGPVAAGAVPFVAAPLPGVPVAPTAERARGPEQTTDEIGLQLFPKKLAVQPGNRVIITAEVENKSPEQEGGEKKAEDYLLEVRGLPSEWYSLPDEALHLGKQMGRANITLHPPRLSTSTAGDHTLDVVAHIGRTPDKYVAKVATLQIEPFYTFTTDLHPRRFTRNQPTQLRITNAGNTPDTFAVETEDPDGLLETHYSQQQITIQPGQTSTITIQARPRALPFTGQSRSLPFHVIIRSTRPGGEQQSQTADLLSSPIIPIWLLGGGIATTGCLGLLLLAILTYLLGFRPQTSSSTSVAAIPTINVTEVLSSLQTQAAPADQDSDGLSDKEEANLGTSPNNKDTDGDGLLDGLEVKSYDTNPLAADTDADGLPDKREIELGTNPRNPDTDGDGIPDGSDPNPLLKATPTADAAASQAAAGTANAAGTKQSQPEVSINDPLPIVEGNVNGTTVIVFTVSLSKTNTGPNPITVNYSITNGTALDGQDFSAAGATPANQLVFPANGPSSAIISVPIISDVLPETTVETFTVTLTQALGATIKKATAIGAINDDDVNSSLPVLSINDPSMVECPAGNMSFAVTMSKTNTTDVKVNFTTVDGSATVAGLDYGFTAGTLTITAGQLSGSIAVPIKCDAVPEPTESFTVLLSNAIGANIGKVTGVGTIFDNNTPLTVSVAAPAAAANEGGSLIFPVTLSTPNPGPGTITVDFTTQDGSAVAPGDYAAQSGTVIFAAGDVTKNITVVTLVDTIPEGAETLNVILSNAHGATIATGIATGTINLSNGGTIAVNFDNAAPAAVTEGASIVFSVNLAIPNPGPNPITVNYATTDGAGAGGAKNGLDYVGQTGSLTYFPGDITKQITVATIDGLTVNTPPARTFTVDLSGPVGAALGTTISSTGTINDNDVNTATPTPTLTPVPITVKIFSVFPPIVGEGDASPPATGVSTVTFTVNLSAANPGPSTITVNYATSDGPTASPIQAALAGQDYVAQTGTLFFAPGVQTQSVTINIVSDLNGNGIDSEPCEQFTLTLSSPSGAVLTAPVQAVSEIQDEDAITLLGGTNITCP